MKRQRGRGRKPGGGHHHHHNQPNRAMESNGPDTKVRGPAALIFERYLQLARDAATSGDRVLSENYMQHADHYFRLVRSMQPATPPPQQAGDRFGDNTDADGEEDTGAESEAGEENETAASGEQPDVDFPEGQQAQNGDREDGSGRRRRGRRSRYRPSDGEGSEGGGEAREGEAREASPREERPRPERRERDGDESGPEGFSSGPKPAFMRD